MRTNKEIRAGMKERLTEVKGKLMKYSLVYFAITIAIGYIPIVGKFLSVIMVILAIGLMASIINIWNGNDAEETPIKFFMHAGHFIKNYICGYLWIVLKCIPGVIIAIVGVVIIIVGGGEAALQLLANEGNVTSAQISNLGTTVAAGFLVYFIGFIVFLVMMLKYSCFSYELIHNGGPEKRAKDIVEGARERLQGHIWQWVCMGIYYGLIMFLLLLLLSFVCGILSSGSIIVASILLLIGYIAIYAYILPVMVCAFEEFYKDLCIDNPISNNTAPSEPVAEPIGAGETDNPIGE